jgi:predicted permease
VFDRSPIDLRVLGVTAAVTIAAAVIATFWPMLRGTRIDLAAALNAAGRTTSSGAARVRAGLLLVQTTLCTALVIGAGPFVRSMSNIERLDLGVDVESTGLVSVELGARANEINDLFDRVLPRVRRLPGVIAAGAAVGAPFQGNWSEGMRIPGRDSIPRLDGGGPYVFTVTPGAIEAFGIRLLEGRSFTDRDRRGSAPVVLISERMARTLWNGEDAIGRCFMTGSDSTTCQEVIGIVADVHRQSLDEDPFMLHFSLRDQYAEPRNYDYLVFLTIGRPDQLAEPTRKILLEERGDLPYIAVTPLSTLVRSQARAWSLGASMFTVFGILSLVIAAVGLYAVIAFAVSQRWRELGIRSALGASSGRLVRMVVTNGMLFVGVGVVLGLTLALALGSRIEPLLFRTRARDALVLGVAASVVLAVGWVSSLVPARRASRISPAEILRIG